MSLLEPLLLVVLPRLPFLLPLHLRPLPPLSLQLPLHLFHLLLQLLLGAPLRLLLLLPQLEVPLHLLPEDRLLLPHYTLLLLLQPLLSLLLQLLHHWLGSRLGLGPKCIGLMRLSVVELVEVGSLRWIEWSHGLGVLASTVALLQLQLVQEGACHLTPSELVIECGLYGARLDELLSAALEAD